MKPSDYLTLLNILVAFLGVLFVIFTLFEWRTLRRLRKDFLAMERRIRDENHTAMKAAHRVISSYGIKDVDARISLLQSATHAYPAAFNGFNALGYAFLEKGETAKAIDAFQQAVERHPHDKAGYCDLGFAYLQDGQEDLAVKYFRQAIDADSSAKEDIAGDTRLQGILNRIL